MTAIERVRQEEKRREERETIPTTKANQSNHSIRKERRGIGIR